MIKDKLSAFVADKSADIGICAIYDGLDTVGINDDRQYPMASVYKFPQALYLTEYVRENKMTFNDTCKVHASDMHTDTWSPMRDRYGEDGTTLTIGELLSYSLQQSDNNACDVLFRISGGPLKVDSMLNRMGYTDIRVISTEDEMHNDPGLSRRNYSTPLAMACLMDDFNTNLREGSAESQYIARLSENCGTGLNRLAKPLVRIDDIVFGHKTGTGDVDDEGRITAVNDAGYVNLPDGHRYSVVVFIADSKYDMPTTEAIISDISEIVL
ncbi:MAG: class A beta-lactamase [Muribaculaceae bacterium]|nr:class A beta-lactamase [Muribaculaceae bacterium]